MARINQWAQLLKASIGSHKLGKNRMALKRGAISFWILLWEARTLVTM